LENLAVDLSDERFGMQSLSNAQRALDATGFTISDVGSEDERFLAWIDQTFGGTWSSEAFAGCSVVAHAGDEIAGFATYDPRGLRFAWLRQMGAQPGVGIFGPFGVAPAHRGSAIGPSLLVTALAKLRERGYSRALIPAVGAEKLCDYYRRQVGANVVERFGFGEQSIDTVVFASGNGSNFAAVLDRVRDGRLPLNVKALICNDPGAYVIERANAAGVRVHTIVWDRADETRAVYDERLRAAVGAEHPQLILLLGWMHLLDENFVRDFPNTINIHPAFLPLDQSRDTVTLPDGTVQPAFRGARALRAALRASVGWTGATAHMVDTQKDHGTVLARKPVRIPPGDNEDEVLQKLHQVEYGVVATAIMRWLYER
jgi:phosphoribosylglycinamide formyltransferase-1